MPTRNYTIQFEADISRLVSNLNQLVGQMDRFHQSTRTADVSLRQLPDLQPTAQQAHSLADAFARIGVATLALNEARKAISAIGEANKEAWEYAEKAAQEHGKLLDSIRELASLKGKAGPTEADVKDVTRTMLAAGMTSPEATAFETSWANTVQPAVDSGAFAAFKPGQLDETKRQMALFAARKGLKPGKLAEMALMSTLGAPVASPDEFYARVQAVSEMADVGLGPATEIEEAMKKNRGLVRPGGGGAFQSLEELGAATSAATTYGAPHRSAHSVEVVWRALTKPEVAEKYGLHGKDFVGRLAVLRDILRAGRAAGKDDQEILSEAGIGTPQNAVALVNMADRYDLVEKWSARVGRGMTPEQKAASIAARSREFTGGNAAYLGSDEGQRKLGIAEAEALRAGPIGAEQMAAQTAMQRAESRMIAGDRSEATRSWWDILNDQINPSGIITGTSSRDRRIRRSATMAMLREARRLGIDPSQYIPATPDGRAAPDDRAAPGTPEYEAWAVERMAYHPDQFAAMARGLAPAIRAQGGSPYGSNTAVRAAIEGQPSGTGSQGAPVKVEAKGLEQAAGTLHAAGQALLEAAKQQGGGLPSFVYPYDADRK